MTLMRSLLLIAALAALAGGGYLAWQQSRAPQSDGALTLYGNVDIRQVDLAFNAEGKITELPVEEGDRVAEGVLLARLDDDLYRQAVAAAEARLAESEARLAELEAGSRPQEIDRAEARVTQLEARVAEAQAELERRRRLLRNGNIAQAAFDEAQRAYDEARALLRQERAELELAREGPRQEAIAAARAQVRFNQALLELARERLGNTELTAPAAGTVLTRIREVGATVSLATPVLTLALRDPVRVRTYVGEPNLGDVVPGMPAEITTDSAPGKVYRGHVGFVSPTAEFTPKTVQTPELRTDLVYRLRVIVANPDDGLRQGMPVTVRLQTDQTNRTEQADQAGQGGQP